MAEECLGRMSSDGSYYVNDDTMKGWRVCLIEVWSVRAVVILYSEECPIFVNSTFLLIVPIKKNNLYFEKLQNHKEGEEYDGPAHTHNYIQQLYFVIIVYLPNIFISQTKLSPTNTSSHTSNDSWPKKQLQCYSMPKKLG